MLKKIMCCVMSLSVYLPVLTQAQDPSQYCNDLYSSDAYDGEDRYRLLQECIASQTDTSQSSAPEEPAYYEGTVEDYVNQAPEQNTTGE